MSERDSSQLPIPDEALWAHLRDMDPTSEEFKQDLEVVNQLAAEAGNRTIGLSDVFVDLESIPESKSIVTEVKEPTPEADRLSAEASKATNEAWATTISKLTPDNQGNLSWLGRRNAKEANGLLAQVVVGGIMPKGRELQDILDYWRRPNSNGVTRDFNKPPVVAVVEEWWRKLSPISKDPRLVPELIRSALVVIRDGQKEAPIDAQQDEITEFKELVGIVKQLASGELKLSTSNKPEEGKPRVADAITATEMILDAAYNSAGNSVRQSDLMRLALFSLGKLREAGLTSEGGLLKPEEAASIVGHLFDAEAHLLAMDIRQKRGTPELDLEVATKQYRAMFSQRSKELAQIISKGMNMGPVNEIATTVLARFITLEKGTFADTSTRLVVNREDEAFDGLKGKNHSLNHDIVVESDDLLQMVQLKARDDGDVERERQKYDLGMIIFLDGTDIIDPENQDSFNDAVVELLRALARECDAVNGAPVREATPRQIKIVADAKERLERYILV